jgi:hypothetical protein
LSSGGHCNCNCTPLASLCSSVSRSSGFEPGLTPHVHDANEIVRKPAGIVFNEHTDEDGAVVFRHACKLGFEGIVSKLLGAPYRSGPSRDWLKVKNPDSRSSRITTRIPASGATIPNPRDSV